MKRLFVAIPIIPSQKLLETVEKLKKTLSFEKIKWVEKQNIHFTLHFFGDVFEKNIPNLCTVFRNISAKIPVFQISINNLGVFRNWNSPNVLWAGIEKSEHFLTLFNEIQNEIEKLDYQRENRFSPHLTLARMREVNDKIAFKNAISPEINTQFQHFEVKYFTLFESILRHEGPIYKSLENFSLKK